MSSPHLTEEDYLARLRQAAIKLKQMEAKLAALEQGATEPIAIIGMACRFPGGAATPEAFWQVLATGVDAVTKVPSERWPEDPYKRGQAATPEERATRWGAFLHDPIDQFDARFFGISPREAVSMDPQQRLLLEVAWEALERAGQVPETLVGSKSGVFLGVNTNDYEQLGLAHDPGALSVYDFTGNGHCFPAGRLSYTLGLQGPSVALDTACSSSLVATHLACQSLRSRDSDLALAGGVSLMLLPWVTHLLSTSQALSPDGRCKTFDARANGYVRGEGCGIVVLKRLADAVADGDPIVAQIRGSAVNQDGRSTGLAAPNVLAQQTMLRAALKRARVVPTDISYVETHGTGTALGDPIEFEALNTVLGAPRPDGSKCPLGAVKTNVGHLEAAAGMTGLIKLVLCLQNQAIPPNLNFEQLNPRIDLDNTPFVIPTQLLPWERGDKTRIAGISGFGMSGTNAHLIVEEAPLPAGTTSSRASRSKPASGAQSAADSAATAAPSAPTAAGAQSDLHIVPLSGRTPAAVADLARAYGTYLAATDSRTAAADVRDVAYTAAMRRNHHKHRLAVVGNSLAEITKNLAGFGAQTPLPGIESGEALTGSQRKVVFVFPGQGSQWLGMGRQLLATEPVFRTALEACDQAIRAEAGWSVLDELNAAPEASRLDQIDVIQPTLFAIAVALAALWRSLGVEPDAVVGHSMGEVAAAHVAGVLSLADATSIICRRSRLLRQVSGQGEMAVVELSMAEARAALAGYEDQLSVAVSNSPRSTVISGAPQALAAVLERLEAEQVFCRRVKVDVASHSPQMDPLRPALLDALAALAPEASKIPMHSTVTGAVLTGTEMDADYWTRNLREPVLFHQVITQLIASDHDLFVEMSPHPLLVPAVEEALREREGATGSAGRALPSMRRDHQDRRIFMESLAAIYAHGGPLDWTRLYPESGRVVPLPTYPWQRQQYWFEGPDGGVRAKAVAQGAVGLLQSGGGAITHPLIGAQVPLSMELEAQIWQQTLDAELAPYLVDHCVQGEIVVPAAAYVEMALNAAMAVYDAKTYIVEPIDFELMMSLSGDAKHDLQLILKPDGPGEAAFRVSTLQKITNAWAQHAYGRVRASDDIAEGADRNEPPQAVLERCPTVIPVVENYELLRQQGLEYGPCFQGVTQLWQGDEEVIGRVCLPEPAASAPEVDAYTLHPSLLDSCFQVLGVLLFAPEKDAPSGQQETYVAVGLEKVVLYRKPPKEVWAYGRLRHREQDGPGRRAGDVVLMDENGTVFAEARGLQAQRLEPAGDIRPLGEEWLYQPTWEHREHLSASASDTHSADQGTWLILQDHGKTGAELAARLQSQGQACVRAVRGQRFRSVEPGLYEVDPDDPESFVALVKDAFGDGSTCRGVLHMWSLDATPTADTNADTLQADQGLSSLSGLYLAQALVQHNWRDTPRLWLVTRGAQAAGPNRDPVAVAQAPLWGLGLVLVIEHPELQCTRVDLSPTPAGDEIATLVNEIVAGDSEDQVALRADGRYVARLVRAAYSADSGAARGTGQPADTDAAAGEPGESGSATDSSAVAIRADATYLITGGLGGLGLSLAQWLVAKGARHLVLMSRRGASAETQAVIAPMAEAGAEVIVAQADVSKYDDVARVIADIDARMPPLAGVVHSAVVIDDRTVLELDATLFHNAMAPKMLGAWNLHSLTADRPLDFFVMYSSAASLVGSPGQGNYVAANAFLDALAQHRKRMGLPVLDINWGAFSDVGLAAAAANRGERLSYRGVGSLTPAEGNTVLHNLLADDLPQVGVIKLNVRQWLEFYPSMANSPLWSHLIAESQDSAANAPGHGGASPLRDELLQTKPKNRITVLERYLAEQMGRVLRLEASEIDRMEAFSNLGLDSLMSIELRNRLEISLGLKLSATLLFTYPNLATLSEFLLSRIDLSDTLSDTESQQTTPEASLPALPVATADSVADLPENLDELVGDDLLQLFDNALDDSLKRIRRN